ncbi:outer membrane protein assembly factor BamA [Sulfurimonas sp. SAG-AH-194-L11]|nr:outer membrane protein assembly factor BamA [Sulfurimonas sp. SAG-AH-194-L11]MDF1876432.1 outer membrane protein assembly factor BamA [Sulfurimonas sp. SAG-AH-194-L11]
MKIFLPLLILLFTFNLSAQTLNSIKFEGMVHISKPVALRMLPFEKGDDVDVKMVDDAIKKYFEQGYFNDIWAEFDNGDLTFFFKEKAIISKIELKGWKENDEEIQDAVIQIKKGTLYNEKILQAAKKRIIEAISQEGKLDSVVEIKKEYLENGSIKVTFIVSEGEEIIIDTLIYSGVNGLDPDDFDAVIANKEHDFMGWFWGQNDGKMKVADLAYDNLRIRDLYMQNGYLDAKVDEPFVRVNFNHYTANMSYQIKEGDVYTIKKVTLAQAKEVVDEELLRSIISLKEGEVFNIKDFREDAEKIKTLVADKSYAFVQVVPDLKKDPEKNTVEVIFKITPGNRVKIRNVVISGNTRTLDRIIRRELYLGPGDMYSLTDLKDSRNSLGRLGYFEGTTIEEKRVDNQTMDLVVKLKETPTGNVQLGGGYGSFGGLLISIGINDRNIWGSGINMGVKAEKSQTTESYSFNVSNNRLNDSDFSGNFSIYTSSFDYNDYSVFSDGISIGTGHRFSRYITGYIGYGFSSNSYKFNNVLDQNTTVIDTFFFEDFTKSGITVSVKWDNTDDFYLPRHGFNISQSFEKTGLGAQADYMKSRSNFGKYIGLEEYIGFDAIFRYKARMNILIDNGYIPLAERFYMGGIGSVRGYQAFSLSPVITDDNGAIRRVGGEKTFSNSLELSMPLIPKAKMRIVVFADWGFIGDDSITDISRGGYGAGLEWFSPVGPIQLMFSSPLNVDDGNIAGQKDIVNSFEFTMGQRF